MEIITRAEAKQRDLEWYYTGRPCIRGNYAERDTKKGGCWCYECREYIRVKARQYYSKNRSRVLDQKKEYHVRNRGKIVSYLRDYYQDNRARLLEQKRTDYTERWDEHRERARAWGQNNPDKIRERNRNAKARRKGAEGTYTNDDVENLYEVQRGKCASCAVSLKKEGYHVDHVIPLAGGGTNWPDNLQLLCPTCNLRKGAKDPYEWAAENGRLI